MSDTRLRSLERAAAAGDVDAAARLARERGRAAQGPPLEALARLGHPPALRALGRPVLEVEAWSKVVSDAAASRPELFLAGLSAVSRAAPVATGMPTTLGRAVERLQDELDRSLAAPDDDGALRAMRRRLGEATKRLVDPKYTVAAADRHRARATLLVAETWSIFAVVDDEPQAMRAIGVRLKRMARWHSGPPPLNSDRLAVAVLEEARAAGASPEAAMAAFAERVAPQA